MGETNYADISSYTWKEITGMCRMGELGVGGYKLTDFGGEGKVLMQIVDVGAYYVTFVAINPLRFQHRMNPEAQFDEDGMPIEMTGTFGAWIGSELQYYLNTVAVRMLEPEIRCMVEPFVCGKLWVPSVDEVFGDEVERFTLFCDRDQIRRRLIPSHKYWLRDAYNDRFACVRADGRIASADPAETLDVIVGFSVPIK